MPELYFMNRGTDGTIIIHGDHPVGNWMNFQDQVLVLLQTEPRRHRAGPENGDVADLVLPGVVGVTVEYRDDRRRFNQFLEPAQIRWCHHIKFWDTDVNRGMMCEEDGWNSLLQLTFKPSVGFRFEGVVINSACSPIQAQKTCAL